MLVAHAGLALDGSRRNFVVVDEVGHLPSGLVQWRTGDFRPYCVNPPLPRMLAALPMLAAGTDKWKVRNWEGKVFEYPEASDGTPVFKPSEDFLAPELV